MSFERDAVRSVIVEKLVDLMMVKLFTNHSKSVIPLNFDDCSVSSRFKFDFEMLENQARLS